MKKKRAACECFLHFSSPCDDLLMTCDRILLPVALSDLPFLLVHVNYGVSYIVRAIHGKGDCLLCII